jgi:two-component system sensor histidine kinase RpfC
MSELTFLHIVRDLDNDRLRKIVASMREPRVALYRLIILALTLPYLWLQSKAAHPMIRETSEAGIWVVAALLPVCLAWWLFVRRRTEETSLRFDIIGIVMDGVIAMIVLKVAFVVLIWFNSLWPLILVRVSALYPRRVFVPATVLTLVAMLLAAPGNYWLERPAYFIYGAVVNVVMPLTMDRIFVALRAIALQAVVSQKAQLRFIGAMSHEMRTPLNAVINATSLIEPERLDAEQREMFSLVTTNADTLLERVNSVLDIAAIGAGKLVVTPAPTSIEAVLRSVYAACSASAAEGAVSLCDTRSGPVETVILSDAGRLNQILINLVGNAIKFTPPGGRVTVESTVAAVGDHLDVRFRVIDTGKGVPDAYKARDLRGVPPGGGNDADQSRRRRARPAHRQDHHRPHGRLTERARQPRRRCDVRVVWAVPARPEGCTRGRTRLHRSPDRCAPRRPATPAPSRHRRPGVQPACAARHPRAGRARRRDRRRRRRRHVRDAPTAV